MDYQLPTTLTEQIYLVGQMEDRYILLRLKSLQLTADTASLISYVNENPGTRQKEICTALNRQAASVTNMIKRLEKRDLIIRRVDRSDSRERQVFLLKDGLKIVDQINQVTADLEILLRPSVVGPGQVDIPNFFVSIKKALQDLEKS